MLTILQLPTNLPCYSISFLSPTPALTHHTCKHILMCTEDICTQASLYTTSFLLPTTKRRRRRRRTSSYTFGSYSQRSSDFFVQGLRSARRGDVPILAAQLEWRHCLNFLIGYTTKSRSKISAFTLSFSLFLYFLYLFSHLYFLIPPSLCPAPLIGKKQLGTYLEK